MVAAQMAMQCSTSTVTALHSGAQRQRASLRRSALVVGAPRPLSHPCPAPGLVGGGATSHVARRKVTVCGLFGLGLPEIAVIAGVAALIWGPSKLPELGKGMGKAVKGFQTAAQEFNAELQKATQEGEEEAGAKKDAAAPAQQPPAGEGSAPAAKKE